MCKFEKEYAVGDESDDLTIHHTIMPVRRRQRKRAEEERKEGALTSRQGSGRRSTP
jgi:hypothetical protein